MVKLPRLKSVSIDTVPLPEKELNLPVKRANIKILRGKYFLQVGNMLNELPVGTSIKTGDVNKLVGKNVIAVYSSKSLTNIIAIGTWPTPESPRIEKKLILCDIGSTPTPELRNVRKRLILSFART